MNSSVVYRNSPAVATTSKVTRGEGEAMVRNVNKNANTSPANKACFITVQDCDIFQRIKIIVLHSSGDIRCESSTSDQPQKLSSGACGGNESMRAPLSHCIKSEENS